MKITPEMVNKLKLFLDLNQISYIQAPSEADYQLTWMSKNNIIQYIISEDTDFLAHVIKNNISFRDVTI